MKTIFRFSICLLFIPGVANCAETLAGAWKTESGETAIIAPCGDNYCITAKSGRYAGQPLGIFSGTGEAFTGRLTDPGNRATYSGKATVSGNSLILRGCATAVLCKSQTWKRLN